MMIPGFTEWAHLRMREHRPGPMSYVVPTSTGQKRSILMRFPSRMPEAGVGPGEYQIPSTMGQCRSTVFGVPSQAVSLSTDGEKKVKLKAKHSKSSGLPPPIPKQYSLALTPDTPAFTMYSKLKENRAVSAVGPGEYVIPSLFDKSNKGPRIGERTKLLSSRDVVPGPGAYDIPRFGDEKPKRNEYITSIRRAPKHEGGPGPGAYDDPTTIAARFALQKQSLCDGPFFGIRCSTFKSNVVATPGPGKYGDVSRILTKKATHTPVFRPPTKKSDCVKKTLDNAKCGPCPGNYLIPSDFDYDYNKGFTFGSRAMPKSATGVGSAIGPGSYDLGRPPMTSNGFRFAAHPYQPFAASSRPFLCDADQKTHDTPGPGAYSANFDAVLPSKYRAVAGLGIGKRFAELPCGGPLCYDVKPPEPPCGTVFYRGDYSRSKHLEIPKNSVCPLYNVENDTIADSVRQNKGFTFGIRYPARAIHQVCKPYDSTTNTNCQYDDETTYMVKTK